MWGWIIITLIASMIIPAYGQLSFDEDNYQFSIIRFSSIPNVCTIPPDDSLLSDSIRQQYLVSTKKAIMEWQYTLQSISKHKENWKINYYEGLNSNCEVIISLKRMNLSEPDAGEIRGQYDPINKTIEVYYQTYSTCGDHGETMCFYDQVIPANEIEGVVKHEFGHAIGLGHYNDEYNGYLGDSVRKSIMTTYTKSIPKLDQITQNDLHMVYLTYGENGFNRGELPNWIKNNAKWYGDNSISEKEYVSALQYLIDQKIIHVNTKSTHNESQIPDWIKNNSKWWASGLITDTDYLKGIEFMINKGIIQIQ